MGLGLREHGEKTARENIARIATAARGAGTTVTLDMEDHTRVDQTLQILRQLRPEFPDLGCVIQSYLRRSPDDCRELATAGSRVRLCKGAYSAAADVAYHGQVRGGPLSTPAACGCCSAAPATRCSPPTTRG